MSDIAENFSYQLAHIHETRQASLLALNGAMCFLATVAVALRLLARRLVSVPWKADDYAIIVALFASYLLLIATIIAVHFGLGLHLFASDLSSIEKYLKTLFVYLLLYCICLPIVKISIILFYKRIFTTRRFTIALNLFAIFVVFWSLSAALTVIFQCQPIEAFWKKSIGGSCVNTYVFILAEGCVTIATDLVLLVLPMPLVWRLKISRKQKLALSGIFLLGGFVLITGVLRMPTLSQIFTLDSTWTAYAPSAWSMVEVNLGIVCACLPVMRPLFRRTYLSTLSRSRVSQPSHVVYSEAQIVSRNKDHWPTNATTVTMCEADISAAADSTRTLDVSRAEHRRTPVRRSDESVDQVITVDFQVEWKESLEISRDSQDAELGLPATSMPTEPEPAQAKRTSSLRR